MAGDAGLRAGILVLAERVGGVRRRQVHLRARRAHVALRFYQFPHEREHPRPKHLSLAQGVQQLDQRRALGPLREPTEPVHVRAFA